MTLCDLGKKQELIHFPYVRTGELTKVINVNHITFKEIIWNIPPDALLMADPADATLETAAGLYVQDVPQTSTFKSLSE